MLVKSAEDKTKVLKERMEAQRKLGAQIDVLMHQAEDGPTPGCGICSLWRRMSRRQRATAVAPAEASIASSTVAAGTTTQTRLFGMKKADPHSKLADAAASMERRIQELELRAQSERAEAKVQMQSGHKTGAMRMLKRAKMTEKQLEANQGSLMAIEQQVDLMAQAQMQKQLASALASSSKGMKAQKKLLKTAESAVDDAQDARDMADDLGQVMTEFANNSSNAIDAEDADLLSELQQMMDGDTNPPAGGAIGAESAALVDIPLDEEARKAEIKRLEERLRRYDDSVESAELLRVAKAMPAAPTAPAANGKSKMSVAQHEKEALLTSVSGTMG
jgi:hypothetical protein